MKRKITFAFFIFLLLGALSVTFLVKTDRMLFRTPVLVQKSPVVTYVIGNAYFKAEANDNWNDIIVGTRLGTGYEIKTGKNSLVDIRLHKNTAIRLTENSTIRFDDLTIKKLLISLERGSIFGRFKKMFNNHSMKVKTPTTIAAIRGTELGIDLKEIIINDEDSDIDDKSIKEKNNSEKKTLRSTVYAMSGIIEIYQPAFREQTVLLSNQNKVSVEGVNPPGNPEKMNEEEILRIQSVLNSLHLQEVLFITNKIYFKVGSSKILPESYPELDKIFEILKKRSESIRIEGHTDSIGAAYENQSLSLNRAKSIQEYIKTKGIDEKRLLVSGFGESKPIADNKKKEGRGLNRRVEFIIVE